MRVLRVRKRVLIPVIVALIAAGAAMAAWLWTQSTNTFQGKTGSAPTLTFNTPTAADFTTVNYVPCTPGGSCGIVGEVTNPTSSPVTLTAYQVSTTQAYQGATCSPSNFTGPAQTASLNTLSPAITIAANASNVPIMIPNALTLASNAPTTCQSNAITLSGGATIALSFSVGS